MSLLQLQLQKKRSALKSTVTIVTTPTGARYVEGSSEQIEPLSYGFVVDTKPDPLPACILERFLYFGSQDAVTSDNVIEYNFTHILSVGIETPILSDLPLNVQCQHLPCLDLPETNLFEDVMPKAIAYIESVKGGGGRVLVHCNAGVSRSAAIVIGYLMVKHCMSYEDAFNLVKSQRACIQPNAGFREQLRSYNG